MSKLLKAWFNEATNEYFTPKIRLVYPALLDAEVNRKFPSNPPKFSSLGLVPKAADVSAIVVAVQKFAADLYGADWKAKAADDPSLAIKMPIKKTANNETLAEFAEEYPLFVNVGAHRDYPPAIFGPDTKPLVKREASEVYSGRWAILAFDVWGPTPEKKKVNRFVSLGVKRVQLLDHDDVIATGSIRTAEGFDAIETATFGGGGTGSADELFA